MFDWTVQEMIDKFQGHIDSGLYKPDDIIAVEYWSYDDVMYFADGDDYYGEVTPDVARAVWGNAVRGMRKYDSIDNDVVNDNISWALDERLGENNG